MTRDHLVMEQRRVQAAALFEMGAAAPEVGAGFQTSRIPMEGSLVKRG